MRISLPIVIMHMHSSFPPSILRTFFIECICILKHAQNAYAFRSDIGLLCEILTVACRMHMHSLTMCTILDNIISKKVECTCFIALKPKNAHAHEECICIPVISLSILKMHMHYHQNWKHIEAFFNFQ